MPISLDRQEEGGAEGAAALQRAVRRGRLAKGKALADLRRDDAVRQRLEQALGYRGHLLRGVGVVAIVRARQRRRVGLQGADVPAPERTGRSEEHTSELQSLMRNSYAVC